MKAIILVGGEGTRMRPLTFHTPKPLLPIANIPFIERQISWLHSHGVEEVTLSLGYLPDAFEDYFQDNPPKGISLSYAVEDEPLGTAGAIKFAANNSGDDLIVCNGDVLTDLDLTDLVDFHNSAQATATIALTHVEDPSSFGVVPTREDGEVIAFVEKPPKESAPSNWINAGIYVLSKDFLELIPEGLNVSIERETFPNLLRDGKMYAKESESYWLDIGTPIQYLKAHQDFLLNMQRFGKTDNLKEVVPGLYSDGDVEIGENVEVLSTCIVGAGTTIGSNSKLDGVVIGSDCDIEDDVVLLQSVLLSESRVRKGSKVSDSIVGKACELSDGVDMAELTLIGSYQKIEENMRLRAERIPSVV